MRRRSREMSGIWDWFRKQPSQPAGPPPPIHINLYDVLRVPPDASQEEIKKAFREQALKFHPDRNPDDPIAERKYREISSAYAILGDDVQRAAYDRLRAQGATEAPKPIRRGMIPRPVLGPETREERPQEKAKLPAAPAPKQLNMWEIMFGKPEEREEAPTGSIFEVMERQAAPPPVIPSAQSPYGWAAPFQKKVPLTPQIDTPTPEEVFQIIQHYWPLEAIWENVRQDRHTAAFHKARAMTVDVLAGAGPSPAEWDLAEIFGIPTRQVDEFVHHRGRQAFFSEILYPIFNVVTQAMGQLKPVDLPGQFFLGWDQSGRAIELIYAENVGRRPWE